LDGLLKKGERKAWAKCRERIRRLAELGYELRRPHADFLRDGIYELRAKHVLSWPKCCRFGPRFDEEKRSAGHRD
jgi:hypothetical protein